MLLGLVLVVMLLESKLTSLLLWGLLVASNVVIRVTQTSIGLALCFESVPKLGVVFFYIELFVPFLLRFILCCCFLAR